MSTFPDAEVRALRHFLDPQRSSVLAILEGLDEQALRTAVLPSGWTPLGLVEHLGHAERHWFQEVATGSAVALPWAEDEDDGGGAPFTSHRATADVLAFYRDQCRRSDAVLDATPLDTAPVRRHAQDAEGEFCDLRRIVLHLVEETARHAGHLDAARELLDGRVGLGPR